MFNVNSKQIVVFVLIVYLGVTWDWDGYQALLAIASAMLAFFFARVTFEVNRFARWGFFVLLTIAITQASVFIKKGVMDDGFIEALKAKPFQSLIGDVVYGAKHIFLQALQLVGGVSDAFVHDNYTFFDETIHIRLLTAFFCILFMSFAILRQAKTE